MKHVEVFIDYLRYEKRYSQHTINSYHKDLMQFVEYSQASGLKEPVIEADHKLVRSWIMHLMDQGLAARSVNRKISALKSFYKYLFRNKRVDHNPMDRVKAPKVRKKLPGFVDEDKMELLLDRFAFGKDFEGTRNRMIIEMFYMTGMRLVEMIELRDQDVDLHELSIRVTGKRNKVRLIPINHDFVDRIKAYREIRDKQFGAQHDDRFFLTKKGAPLYRKLVYRVVRSYLELVTTAEKKSPHVLRHTFATHMLNKGADLNAIKEILGHANLAATEVYTHNTFEKLKSIYKQAHPRA